MALLSSQCQCFSLWLRSLVYSVVFPVSEVCVLLCVLSSLPSHRNVSYEDLLGALQQYGTCQQRLGQWGAGQRPVLNLSREVWDSQSEGCLNRNRPHPPPWLTVSHYSIPAPPPPTLSISWLSNRLRQLKDEETRRHSQPAHFLPPALVLW